MTQPHTKNIYYDQRNFLSFLAFKPGQNRCPKKFETDAVFQILTYFDMKILPSYRSTITTSILTYELSIVY